MGEEPEAEVNAKIETVTGDNWDRQRVKSRKRIRGKDCSKEQDLK